MERRGELVRVCGTDNEDGVVKGERLEIDGAVDIEDNEEDKVEDGLEMSNRGGRAFWSLC
jgi:hypothetical protein